MGKVAKTKVQRMRYYKLSCKKGYAEGCTEVGFFYLQGMEVTLDYKQAMTYLKAGCQGGDWAGCWKIAIIYHYGLGQERDAQKSLFYAKKAYRMKKESLQHPKWMQ